LKESSTDKPPESSTTTTISVITTTIITVKAAAAPDHLEIKTSTGTRIHPRRKTIRSDQSIHTAFRNKSCSESLKILNFVTGLIDLSNGCNRSANELNSIKDKLYFYELQKQIQLLTFQSRSGSMDSFSGRELAKLQPSL
jgi:hypothetical protein